MLPINDLGTLEDLCLDLCSKASSLTSQLNSRLIESVSDLVRSMNCYYSNLIEGHHTLPRDIEKALAENFDSNPEKRDLQLEAKAHIEVQMEIDSGNFWGLTNLFSREFLLKVHQEFYLRLPPELKKVFNKDSAKELEVVPGKFRDGDVVVGRHIPPQAKYLQYFLERFEQAYSLERLSKLKQVISVAASHHRLLWIHPFYDGNGRVARLFSHALLRHLDLGSSLWSASRGLARNKEKYRELLAVADLPRQGDLDGRGNLSDRALKNFCEFFLKICIDQVSYMKSLLEPKEILRRIEHYVDDRARAKKIDPKAFLLLREAYYQGEFARGQAQQITGYQATKAREVLSSLVARGLLRSDTPKGAVRLAFPVDVLEWWFPRLYDRVQ